jgi:hypothetical protein
MCGLFNDAVNGSGYLALNVRVPVSDEYQRMWKEESITLDNRPNSFEYEAKFKYLETTQTTQNCFREELRAD